MRRIGKFFNDTWKKLSPTERSFIISILILIVVILLRFSYVKKEAQRGFNTWFEDKTEKRYQNNLQELSSEKQ